MCADGSCGGGGLLVSATWRDGELVGLEVEAELSGTFELARGEARVLA